MSINTWSNESAVNKLILPLSKYVQSKWWLTATISSYMDLTCILSNSDQYRSILKVDPCSWTIQCVPCVQTSALSPAWQLLKSWLKLTSNTIEQEAYLRCWKETVSFNKEKIFLRVEITGHNANNVAHTTQKYYDPACFPHSIENHTGSWLNLVYYRAEVMPEESNIKANTPSRTEKALYDQERAGKQGALLAYFPTKQRI